MRRSRWTPRFVVTALAVVTLAVAILAAACGSDDDPSSDLLARFAPVLRLHADEVYAPLGVQIFFDHATLQGGAGDAIDADAIGAIDDPDTALDLRAEGFNLSVASPDLAIAAGAPDPYTAWYATQRARYGLRVHAALREDGNALVLQYWFFYPFNNHLNRHEGDWEWIQLVFLRASVDAPPADGALPDRVAYSQHGGGTQRDWSSTVREGDHPVVYVARGSHANYLRPGRCGSDTVPTANRDTKAGADENGRDLRLSADDNPAPGEYALIVLTDQPWLAFPGHWGERCAFGFGCEGPTGPAAKGAAWDTPAAWAAALPPDCWRATTIGTLERDPRASEPC